MLDPKKRVKYTEEEETRNYMIKPERSIICTVGFGNPKNNCNGQGICLMRFATFEDIDHEVLPDGYSLAYIFLNDYLRIVFYFINDTMSKKTKEAYFHGDTFNIYEPFEVTNDIGIRIGNIPVLIPPGKYKIHKADEFDAIVI